MLRTSFDVLRPHRGPHARRSPKNASEHASKIATGDFVEPLSGHALLVGRNALSRPQIFRGRPKPGGLGKSGGEKGIQTLEGLLTRLSSHINQ